VDGLAEMPAEVNGREEIVSRMFEAWRQRYANYKPKMENGTPC
jgi:hypothetical protein